MSFGLSLYGTWLAAYHSSFVRDCAAGMAFHKRAGAAEDINHHGLSEAPGVGVLQGRMIRTQERDAVGQLVRRAVTENEAGFRGEDSGTLEMIEVCIKGNLAKNKNHRDALERFDLARNVEGAIGDFFRRGFVIWRRTVDNGSDVGVIQLLSIAFMESRGL